MSLPSKLAEIIEDLSFFPDRAEKIQVLISIAERFRPISPELASPPYDEAHKVPACESEAYGWAWVEEGKLRVEFAVLNPQGISAMTMAVVLRDALNGEDPALAAGLTEDVVYSIFGRELSMGKSAGLMGMVSLVRHYAALGRSAP